MSKKRVFLLTPQGHKLVSEYTRNLTPQIALFSIAIVVYARAYDKISENYSDGMALL